jgi:hypothetical protein
MTAICGRALGISGDRTVIMSGYPQHLDHLAQPDTPQVAD